MLFRPSLWSRTWETSPELDELVWDAIGKDSPMIRYVGGQPTWIKIGGRMLSLEHAPHSDGVTYGGEPKMVSRATALRLRDWYTTKLIYRNKYI